MPAIWPSRNGPNRRHSLGRNATGVPPGGSAVGCVGSGSHGHFLIPNARRIMRVITRQSLEAALEAIETRLASDFESESLDLMADRARLLTELSQTDEAKHQYLEILKRDPR